MTLTHRRSVRTTLVCAVTGMLILPATLATAAPPEAGPDCQQVEAENEDQAFALAEACGTDVEILAERSPWTNVYATSEGTIRVDTSISAQQTDVSGEWEPIDTSLTATSDGITVAAPVFEMTFSGGGADQPLATIVKDEHVLAMDSPIALTSPEIDGRTITYPAVLDGVDLIVTVDADGTGFTQVLRVNDAEAAANPALHELTFPVQTSTQLNLDGEAGGFVAVDTGGEPVFTSPQPLMWDSSSTFTGLARRSTTTSGGLGDDPASHEETTPRENDTVLPMPAAVSSDAITIEPDQEMLTDDETVWPVYIDPSVSGSLSKRTVVRSGYPTDTSFYNWTGDQGLGYCATSGGCTRNGIYRMFFNFGGLSTIGALNQNDVISATFRVYGKHSWSCTPRGVELWQTGSISSSTNWNNQPSWQTKIQTKNLAHKAACASPNGERWIEWNATAAAKSVASSSASTVTLGMKTVVENNMTTSWQRYRHDAQFSVVYSRPPTKPTSLATSPVTQCTTTGTAPYFRVAHPTFTFKVTDPDGGNVQAHLDIIKVSNGSVAWNPALQTKASGSTFTMQVPTTLSLEEGVLYEWKVNGKDVQTGRDSPTAACRFYVDATSPSNPPGITNVTTGYPATYPQGVTSGAVGEKGAFKLDNGGVSDVVSYRYSFESDALNETATASSSGPIIEYTPITSGRHTLYAISVDRAGNVSPLATYDFIVERSEKASHWDLNEGTGTVAADSVNMNNLTLNAAWADGPLADYSISPNDKALQFSASTHTATSAWSPINTADSYTVMAYVNTTQLANAATAVSQDGPNNAAYRLGLLPASECGSLGSACWGFQVMNSDSAASTIATARSTTPAEADRWYHLTGVRDGTSNTLTLYVCDLGDGAGEPIQQLPNASVSGGRWTATGNVQLGGSRVGASNGQPWYGRIDDVRIYDIPVTDIGVIRRACQGVADD